MRKILAILAFSSCLSPSAYAGVVTPDKWTQNYIPTLDDWQAALLYKGKALSIALENEIERALASEALKLNKESDTSTNQTLINPAINNGNISGGNITSANLINSLGVISGNSYFTNTYHAVPDFYIQSGDNGDDALSINRAINSCDSSHIRCEIDFLPRVYKLNSGVNAKEKQVILKGMGTQERTSQISGTNTVTPWGGTWLQVSTTGFVPVTFGGYGGGGSEVRDLGIYEVQPAPVDGQAWAPTPYGPFFSSSSSLLPVRYHNIDMLGITQGIYSDGDQRLEIDNIRGQVFQYGISLHHVYDAPSINSLHFWPYWSQDASVLSYQQANSDSIVLGRVDGAFIDQVFCFGCRSAYHLTNDGTGAGGIPGGPSTKIMTGSTYCDFAYTCIYADSSSANFDISALYMSSQGQKWSPSSSTAVPLGNASALHIEGYGNLNIHELYTQYMDNNVVSMTNAAVGSYANIGSLRATVDSMRSNSFLFGAIKPSTGADVVTLGTLPLIIGQRPSGFTIFQTDSSLTVIEPQTRTVASGEAP